jgi:hypothetical protein
MKNNILKRSAALFCMAAFLFAFVGTTAAKTVKFKSDDECLAEMAEETAAYMRSANIQIANSTYSFTNNEGEKVYSVTSTDSVKAGSSLRRTQSVILHKNSAGDSEFYVIDLESRSDSLNYTITRGLEVIDRIGIPIDIGVPPNPCAGALTQAQVNTILQNLQAQANATCKDQYTCLFQMMGSSCAYVMYVVKPTSWKCKILIAVDVATAINRVIKGTKVEP